MATPPAQVISSLRHRLTEMTEIRRTVTTCNHVHVVISAYARPPWLQSVSVVS
jgi:hypothetical protein